MTVLLMSLLPAALCAPEKGPTEAFRGYYVQGQEPSDRSINIYFGLDARFWIAQMAPVNSTARDVQLYQWRPIGAPIAFRPAMLQEWIQAKAPILRLFFDAVFWRDSTKQTRPVLVRRVDDKDGHATIYVEPLP